MLEQKVVTYIPNIWGERNELYNNLHNKQLIGAVTAMFYSNFITIETEIITQ